MSQLPTAWETTLLSQVTEKIGSGATPRGGHKAYVAHGVPLIRSQNIHFAGFSDTGIVYLSKDQAEKLNNAEVRSGDVLLNITGASIGRVTTAPERMNGARVNQHVAIIRLFQGIDPNFIAQLFSSPPVQKFISTENYGVTRQALTKAMIEATTIVIPPLPEQRRIVAKIDSLSAKSSRARDHLDHVARLVRKYKQAVVVAAFKGGLTQDFAGSGTPDWAEFPLSSLLAEGPSNGWSPRSGDDATGALTLKLTATTSGALRLDAAATKRIYEVPPAASPYWLRPGDILVQRANALDHVGATAIFDGPIGTYIYPDLMMRLRVSDRIDGLLIWRYLNSDMGRSYLRDRATGTAGNMPKISGSTLRSVPIPLPRSSVERAAIVRRIETAFAWIDRLAAEAGSACALLDRLDQAVLAKAFRGELVLQDPNDEPASVLLKRIRAERAAAGPGQNRGRRPRAASGG